MKKVFSSLLVLFAAVFLFGCAHQVPVTPSADNVFGDQEKIPVNLGLYISREFRAFQVSEGRMGDTWVYSNLGTASATVFREALERRFEHVTLLSSRVPEEHSSVVAVVEPEISRFTFDIPITKFQVYPATMHYKVTLFDREGGELFAAFVDGVGDTAGSPGFDFAANPSQSATKAVEEGVRQAIEEVVRSDALRRVIEGNTGAPPGRVL